MSTMTDEKIVKMEFDNSDFEKNTKQTLGTLDKLHDRHRRLVLKVV